MPSYYKKEGVAKNIYIYDLTSNEALSQTKDSHDKLSISISSQRRFIYFESAKIGGITGNSRIIKSQ